MFPVNILMRDILLPIYTVILPKALTIFTRKEIIHYERKISTWKRKNNRKSTQY